MSTFRVGIHNYTHDIRTIHIMDHSQMTRIIELNKMFVSTGLTIKQTEEAIDLLNSTNVSKTPNNEFVFEDSWRFINAICCDLHDLIGEIRQLISQLKEEDKSELIGQLLLNIDEHELNKIHVKLCSGQQYVWGVS